MSPSYTWGLDLLAIGDPHDPEPARLALVRMDEIGVPLGLRVDAPGRRLVDATSGQPVTGHVRDWGAVAAIIAEVLGDARRNRYRPRHTRAREIRAAVRAELARWLQ